MNLTKFTQKSMQAVQQCEKLDAGLRVLEFKTSPVICLYYTITTPFFYFLVFTQKSMQAVQQCEKLAYEYGNQEIEQEHLLYSLLTIDDSLILKLIEKMEIQKEYFTNRVEQGIRKRVASGLSEVTL